MSRSSATDLAAWPAGVRAALRTRLGPEPEQASCVAWFFDEGRLDPEVRRYTAFLKVMHESFHAAAELFDHWSPPGSAGTKSALRLTHPEEQLYLANHLYLLDSEGVKGDVLECGCAHGFSSACLSLACAALGRRLIVADSFEGLPDTHPDEPFFRKGDYASAEQRVLEHIRLCGRQDVVETVKGWYRDSLRGWRRQLALLWVDVDLYESARDLLPHVMPSLDPRGALFTHEFTDFHGNIHPAGSHTVPGAIYEYFQQSGTAVVAEPVCRYWGAFGGPEATGLASHVLLDQLRPHLLAMDPRWRLHDELLNCRTVRVAFAVKKLLDRG